MRPHVKHATADAAALYAAPFRAIALPTSAVEGNGSEPVGSDAVKLSSSHRNASAEALVASPAACTATANSTFCANVMCFRSTSLDKNFANAEDGSHPGGCALSHNTKMQAAPLSHIFVLCERFYRAKTEMSTFSQNKSYLSSQMCSGTQKKIQRHYKRNLSAGKLFCRYERWEIYR